MKTSTKVTSPESHETESKRCEVCGRTPSQRAHIVAEQEKQAWNILYLCPTCHVVFDTILKPRLVKALTRFGSKALPKSWESSIYEQAAVASQVARRKKQATARAKARKHAAVTKRTWLDPAIRARRIASIREAKARR
jgi:hypothetical protein